MPSVRPTLKQLIKQAEKGYYLSPSYADVVQYLAVINGNPGYFMESKDWYTCHKILKENFLKECNDLRLQVVDWSKSLKDENDPELELYELLSQHASKIRDYYLNRALKKKANDFLVFRLHVWTRIGLMILNMPQSDRRRELLVNYLAFLEGWFTDENIHECDSGLLRFLHLDGELYFENKSDPTGLHLMWLLMANKPSLTKANEWIQDYSSVTSNLISCGSKFSNKHFTTESDLDEVWTAVALHYFALYRWNQTFRTGFKTDNLPYQNNEGHLLLNDTNVAQVLVAMHTGFGVHLILEGQEGSDDPVLQGDFLISLGLRGTVPGYDPCDDPGRGDPSAGNGTVPKSDPRSGSSSSSSSNSSAGGSSSGKASSDDSDSDHSEKSTYATSIWQRLIGPLLGGFMMWLFFETPKPKSGTSSRGRVRYQWYLDNRYALWASVIFVITVFILIMK